MRCCPARLPHRWRGSRRAATRCGCCGSTTRPIGVWDEVREDGKGLWVKGRLLPDVAQAREAAALIQAGAIDGLSIGYRTLRAERDKAGRRVLAEVELWEVSLVTFPMLAEAKVDRKDSNEMRDVAALFVQAAQALRGA